MVKTFSARMQFISSAILFGLVILVLYGLLPYTYSHLQGVDVDPISAFSALWLMWNRDPEFQHGMLVPLICGVIVYLRRDKLRSLPVTGSFWGIPAVLLALAVYWVGRRVDNQYLGFFSFQIFLSGSVLLFLGWSWIKALLFPLAFLIFAWPMPFLDNLVAFPLRMIMSSASVQVLNFLGVATVQQGTAILSAADPMTGLPASKAFAVDVADPCSGIRSLYALTMVTALFAYFTLKSTWKQIVLFLCAIPLAILGNLFRILLLTFGTIIFGPQIAIGTEKDPSFYHTMSGFFVFVIALIGMLGISALLQTTPREIYFKCRKWLATVQSDESTAEAKPLAASTHSSDPY